MHAVLQDIHVTAYSPLGSPDSATMMKRPDDTPSLMVRCALCHKAIASVAILEAGCSYHDHLLPAAGLMLCERSKTILQE